jgi:hypothetical protein
LVKWAAIWAGERVHSLVAGQRVACDVPPGRAIRLAAELVIVDVDTGVGALARGWLGPHRTRHNVHLTVVVDVAQTRLWAISAARP